MAILMTYIIRAWHIESEGLTRLHISNYSLFTRYVTFSVSPKHTGMYKATRHRWPALELQTQAEQLEGNEDSEEVG